MSKRQPSEAATEMRAYLSSKPTRDLIGLAVGCRNGIVRNASDAEGHRTGLDFVLEALGPRMTDSDFERFCGALIAARSPGVA